ncbi:uncharacterized protein NEMAJ01_2173 [Nematocida major]|uniref:uncharacterized protein n=1 Tax=Nematocida major TaxID=1912982 RepID=UPI002008C9C3|nr:uncharacterized protein NEMAJ01_2173 [Nematocida major]KAH9387277.1 hypothetical protein NEMAJ01_2173 [Nematocida major]
MSMKYTQKVCKKRGLFPVLKQCIEVGKIRKLKYLMQKHRVDPSLLQSKNKCTLLHVAAAYNRSRIALFLIEQGSSIYHQNSKNECPYYVAVVRGCKNVLKYMEDVK